MKKGLFQQQIFSEIERLIGKYKMIVIAVPFLKFCGDLETAVFLSHLIYLSDKGKRLDKYIYKSCNEWKQETGLSEYRVKKATKKFKKMGILRTKKKKATGSPTWHYKLDREAFKDVFFKFLQSEKLLNESSKTEKSIRESTSENNKEITTEKKTLPSNKGDKYFSKFWDIYPNQLNFPLAKKEWKTLNPDDELALLIIRKVKEFKDSGRWDDPKYIPAAHTFLKYKRWTDKIPSNEPEWLNKVE
jgi:hypothetical protein